MAVPLAMLQETSKRLFIDIIGREPLALKPTAEVRDASNLCAGRLLGITLFFKSRGIRIDIGSKRALVHAIDCAAEGEKCLGAHGLLLVIDNGEDMKLCRVRTTQSP